MNARQGLANRKVSIRKQHYIEYLQFENEQVTGNRNHRLPCCWWMREAISCVQTRPQPHKGDGFVL